MNEKKKNEELVYDGSVKVDNTGKAILGTLEGPCADFLLPTRNGRFYSEDLWEKVFNNPIIQELFDCGGILGELDHPDGRDETVTEKVAICMPEPPKKNKDGKLIGRFHILDTPNGRIAKTLCDYGYKFGISSRGSGDVTEDFDGKEVVDPETYDFKAFDLVLLPAVKSARLKVVESLQNTKTLKKALCESLENAEPDARRIMTETLDHLHIDYQEEISDATAVDDAKVELMKELQEAVKAKQQLEVENRQLQEKLSVCYAKETKSDEDLKRYQSIVVDISTTARKVKPLQTKVEALESLIKEKDNAIKAKDEKIKVLNETVKANLQHKQQLRESVGKTNTLVETLTKTNKRLTEQLAAEKDESKKRELVLQESIEEMRKNSMLKNNEYVEKVKKANALVEKYKVAADKAINSYISAKAKTLGVNPQEIKSKLNENYTLEDIDEACKDVRSYQLNISKLPFDVKRAKVQITESKETIGTSADRNIDDTVDNSLYNLANQIIK